MRWILRTSATCELSVWILALAASACPGWWQGYWFPISQFFVYFVRILWQMDLFLKNYLILLLRELLRLWCVHSHCCVVLYPGVKHPSLPRGQCQLIPAFSIMNFVVRSRLLFNSVRNAGLCHYQWAISIPFDCIFNKASSGFSLCHSECHYFISVTIAIESEWLIIHWPAIESEWSYIDWPLLFPFLNGMKWKKTVPFYAFSLFESSP